MHVRTCTYLLLQSANSISSRGDYSRAASISFRACSGAATIRERRLFESGVYSRAAFIRERRLFSHIRYLATSKF